MGIRFSGHSQEDQVSSLLGGHENSASNQQEQIESVQKEMSEMKQYYEHLLREKN